MLTLERFKAMADSYGADLRRWPEERRGDAAALLEVSLRARAILDEARGLDRAIAAAGARSDAIVRRSGEPDAALARLRSGIAARIGSPAGRLPAGRLPAGRLPADRRAGWTPGGRGWGMLSRGMLSRGMLSRQFRWAGMVAGGGAAIAAGLVIGALSASMPVSVPASDVLTMLQPAPLQMLSD